MHVVVNVVGPLNDLIELKHNNSLFGEIFGCEGWFDVQECLIIPRISLALSWFSSNFVLMNSGHLSSSSFS